MLDIMNQTRLTQKAILKSDPRVATHTSDAKKIKVAYTSNRNFQQKVLSNRTHPIITLTIDPLILDMVATCGGTPCALITPTTKEVIMDAACISTRVLRTPGHVSRMSRYGTTPRNGDVVVRSSRYNRPVLIGGIGVPQTMGNSGSQDILKNWKSTSPSLGRNAQKFDASVDGSLINDGDFVSIFIKVLGHKLVDSISADIYSRCRLEFTSNFVGTKAPDFVHLGIPDVNSSDEFDAFVTPSNRVNY